MLRNPTLAERHGGRLQKSREIRMRCSQLSMLFAPNDKLGQLIEERGIDFGWRKTGASRLRGKERSGAQHQFPPAVWEALQSICQRNCAVPLLLDTRTSEQFRELPDGEPGLPDDRSERAALQVLIVVPDRYAAVLPFHDVVSARAVVDF
jgi:hypothetical protein